MSELRADTITASDGTSPVTLTKQEATKFWLSFDSVNNDIEGSLNASSYTDEKTGTGTITITNAFASQHDRCITLGIYNSQDDGANAIGGASRAFCNINIGDESNADIDPLAAGSIQFTTARNGNSTSNGGLYDVSKAWLNALGDLA